MDLNLTGYFWGMPVNLSGDVAANFIVGTPENISSVVPNMTIATPWYTTFGAALIGAVVGGLITFLITYAKGRAEMKWGFKRDTVMAIINELDQSSARNPGTNKAIHRRTGHLIRIAFKNTKIRTTADKIINNTGMTLAEFQALFDNELMPLVEKDLEESMNNWWQFWK